MNQQIGECSLCGGPVWGWSGPWHGIIPPPPARCAHCGAVESRGPVIPMRPLTLNDGVSHVWSGTGFMTRDLPYHLGCG